VHFNNAGASLMPRPVIEAVAAHLELEAAIGGYEAAERKALAIETVYVSLAQLIGATPDEIAVTENATRAFDLAFYSLNFNEGDRILVGSSEYISHRLAYRQIEIRCGAIVEPIPTDETGKLALNALAEMLDERVRLVSLGHISTNSGLVEPVHEVGALLRGSAVLYLVDACQSIGQRSLDVRAINCDILTATGRKYLRGPRGTGFLYVRKELLESLEPPFADVRGAALSDGGIRYVPSGQRFESWECNVAAKLGLGAAAAYAQAVGLEAIAKTVAERGRSLRQALATLDADVLEPEAEPSGLVTFALPRHAAEAVKKHLAARAINVSVSNICETPMRPAPNSHEQWIRASAHYFNHQADCDALMSAIARLQ
jgi:selenocysteine lyase/cysteine desulfurase